MTSPIQLVIDRATGYDQENEVDRTAYAEEEADLIAATVLRHIDTMYPGLWKGAPKSARMSVRNTIRREVLRILPTNVQLHPVSRETPPSCKACGSTAFRTDHRGWTVCASCGQESPVSRETPFDSIRDKSRPAYPCRRCGMHIGHTSECAGKLVREARALAAHEVDTRGVVANEAGDEVEQRPETPEDMTTPCPCQGVCCNAYFGETFTGCRGLEGALLPKGRIQLAPPWRWSEMPVGTRAVSATGGHWEKDERGWSWCTGATFPRPGGDVVAVYLPAPIEGDGDG